ncbi:MAG: hypothetical protein M3394_05545 [Actinomycetota bacterium]|nr:hypothetical protein [Actinomycetota bacterium]
MAGVLLVLALGACARSEARPAGIAERWLQAVSELGRDGLREDAEERLREHGTAAPIDVPDAEDDERTFSDMEVGKAREDAGNAFVPFRVNARIEGDERREIRGVLRLARQGDSWSVTEVLPAGPGDKVPSEGGERPARSKPSQWALAALLGVLMTAGSVFLIERQPHPESRH